MNRMRAIAPAKVNLSLRIRSKDASGLHPIVSLAQTIGWHDVLTLEDADEDSLVVHGAEIPTDGSNLVWKAVTALRAEAGTDRPAAFELTKRIPAAAGLGGGSSDAAAALRLYGRHVSVADSSLDSVAPSVGADVAFCLHGALRWVEGYGEKLSAPLDAADDYWVVVAVPPFELDTPGVYAAWDRLDEPQGPSISGTSLPPSLRSYGPLSNDLYPAAVAQNAALDDWRAELAMHWDRDILLSGSGPSLFGFFADEPEARGGLSLVPTEARSAFAAEPIGYGVLLDDQ